MNNRPPRLAFSEAAITVSDLERYADGWLLAGEISQHSERTLGNRRDILAKLIWFLKRQRADTVGVDQLRAFLAYLTTGHKEPGGRWGNPQNRRPVSPRTVKDYHSHLRTLFRWIVAEGGLDVSPMERIPVPIDRPDDVQPFTEEQVKALAEATRRTRHPQRDVALLWFLVDTGVRASELCGLRFCDIEMSAKKASVEGKGGKRRDIYFGRTVAKAVFDYLKTNGRERDEPVFLTERGDPFTRDSLRQWIERLGKSAGVAGAHLHRCRHTFAVSFLRNGGNQLTLMRLLGHTNLQMTARYVRLAQADVERQHRQFSPADTMKGGRPRVK